MESDVRELLVDALKDANSAEKQALRCMQRRPGMPCSPIRQHLPTLNAAIPFES
jgi:hypothetical protein